MNKSHVIHAAAAPARELCQPQAGIKKTAARHVASQPARVDQNLKSPMSVFQKPLRNAGAFIIAVASAAFLPAASAEAQTTNEIPSDVLSAPVEVEFTPDLWALTTITKTTVDGQTVESRLHFGEAARHISSMFLGKMAVKKGPLVLMADINFADVHLSGSDVPSTLNQIDLSSVWATVGVGYNFTGSATANGRRFQFEVQPTMAAHYTSQEVAIKPVGGQTLQALNAKWWTPTIGINARVASGAWGLRVLGETDIAGPSRGASQVAASVEYSPRSIKFGRPTFGVGYRYRYDRRTYSPDSELSTTLRGPMAYVTFHL